MRYGSALLAAAVPALVSAAPIGRRTGPSANDILVFQFADVLEQLETQFYQQALTKFQASDITAAGFQNPTLLIEQLTSIHDDEATHASVLESQIEAFGQSRISQSCNFDFTPLLTDLPTTLGAARLVENLGVAAYVGAAHILDDGDLLSAAASIATVEARHQTILNVLSGGGTVIPQAFDLALLPNEVLATAGQFITGSGCSLGVTGNTALSMSPAAPQPNTTLQFNSTALTGDMSSMFCQIMSGNLQSSLNATVLPANQCTIPADINGPIAVFITSTDQPLPNDPVARGNINNTVAGPALTFVDALTELLPPLVRKLSAPVGQPATTTIITSTGNANSIITGANGTDSAAFIPQINTVCSGCNTTAPGSQNDFQGPTVAPGVVVVGFGTSDASSGADASSDGSSTGSSDASATSTDSSADASATDGSSASATDSSADASATDSSADASATDSSSASATDSSADASATDSSADASATDSSADASATDSSDSSDSASATDSASQSDATASSS